MKVIVIQGFIGSGKDTLANLLLEKYPNGIKLSFASALKDVVSCIFGWDRKLLEGDSIESRLWREKVDEWWSKRLGVKNLTPRFILQNIGTNLFRNHFHPDIWIASIERKILESKNLNYVIITDCRFENEVEMLKKFDSKFFNIRRGELPEWVKDYIENDTKPENIHCSEYLWLKNNFDYIIENNQDLESLKSQVSNLKILINSRNKLE
jgi:hypothetical protein